MSQIPHVPEKRQSIRPPLAALLGILGVAVVLAVVWLSVSAAVTSGGQDCATQRESAAAGDRCR